MNIKKNGSVWLLATFGGKLPLLTNFCHVFWLCVLSLTTLTAVIGLGGWFLGDLIASTIVWIQTGGLYGAAQGIVVLVCIALLAATLTTLIYGTGYVLKALGMVVKTTTKTLTPSSDSFINTTYRSWKDKYYPTVTEVE
tara:strand:+ start:2928 stop:3344 length:417 start_codon:yes stop_codon:yes gene_type:complete